MATTRTCALCHIRRNCFSYTDWLRSTLSRVFPFSKYVAKASGDASPLATSATPESALKTLIKDKQIPFSRRNVIRELLQKANYLTDGDRQKIYAFINRLDNVLYTRYYAKLKQLELLFEPINPDKMKLVETRLVGRRPYNNRDRLDSEYWFLHELRPILYSSGFRELEKNEIRMFLQRQLVPEALAISMDEADYSTLRIWVLGLQSTDFGTSSFMSRPSVYRRLYYSVMSYLDVKHSSEVCYHRVVLAVRRKDSNQLHFKMFSDVPASHFLYLLPQQKIHFSRMDNLLLKGLGGLFGVSLVSGILSSYMGLKLALPTTLAMGSLILFTRLYIMHYERRVLFLSRTNQLMYSNGVANNSELLFTLTDQAQDEVFKNSLLLYMTLLELLHKGNAPVTLNQLKIIIKQKLEDGLLDQRFSQGPTITTAVQLCIDSALQLLHRLQLVTLAHEDGTDGAERSSKDDEVLLQVVPLDTALTLLPSAIWSMEFILSKENDSVRNGRFSEDRYAIRQMIVGDNNVERS